jgi:uncharacterized protein YraI
MRNLIDSFKNRPVQLVTTFAAAIVGMLITMPGVAQAYVSSATGTVNTAGTALNVRSGPSTSYTAWRTVADGSTVTILCQQNGESVTGTYGTTTLWDYLSNGGMVSDSYINTGSDGQIVNTCPYAAAPPRSNPSSANGAINWAFQRLGYTSYEGWCLKFTAQAYGWGAAGWTTAEVGGDYMVSHGYMHTDTNPPRGALVWYHNSSGTGHITISLGEGKVIGTSVGGAVGVANYNYHSDYRGWSVAYYPYAG